MDIGLHDANLAKRIGSGGDRDAETELFRRMAPRVRLYGLRHLRDTHAADDLVQQVWLTTIEALRAGRLREPDRLVSFVLGTCRMTVLAMRRVVQRKAQLLEWFGADLVPPSPASVPLPDDERLVNCVQSSGTGADRGRHDLLR